MLLSYEAIDADGQTSSATVEAAGHREAVEDLRRRGLFVTNIAKSTSKEKAQTPSSRVSRKEHLPLTTLVLSTKQLAMMLRAGTGVVPAFSALKRQARKPQHAALFGRIITNLEDGVTLTDAMRKFPSTFTASYCAIVAAGESSGKLSEMFDRLAIMVARTRAIRNKVLGAMAYPALLIMMSGNILIALLFFVVPRFSSMFDQLGVDPPASTKVLLSTGAFLGEHWTALLLTMLASMAGLVALVMSDRGRQWMADLQLKIPMFGRLRVRLIQAQLFRTMGMLLESGVSVLDTLELIRGSTRNSRFRRLFRSIEESVTAGGSISRSFEESGLIEPYICQAIQTGEETGSIGGALTYGADMLDETNEELINTTMRLIEPVILIGLGFVVGSVAISLFLPLFDLTSAMR